MSGYVAGHSWSGQFPVPGGQQQTGTVASYTDEDCNYCKLCNVSFSTSPQYAFHVRGLSHIQKLMAAQAGMLPSWTEQKRTESRQWQALGTLPAKTKGNTSSPMYPGAMQYSGEGIYRDSYNRGGVNSLPPGGGASGMASVSTTGGTTAEMASASAGSQSGSKQADATESDTFYCDICVLDVERKSVEGHLNGQKHLKALKHFLQAARRREEGKPLPHKVQERLLRKQDVVGPGVSTDLVERFSHVPSSEPVVGLSFVYEEPGDVSEFYHCDLCQFQVSDLSAIISHVTGLDHRLAYLKRREPQLHGKMDMTQNEFIQHHTARVLCLEAEKKAGRGVPMLRDPVKNSIQLQLAAKKLGVQKVGDEEVQPQSLEDVMIIGARRILHLQQLMAQKALKLDEGSTVEEMASSGETQTSNKIEAQEKPFDRDQAIEDLKKLLLEDFRRRNMDDQLASKIVESRLQLLFEYERRDVPFDVARERVIQEEERYNLLLEFERQNLSFEEAEQRIDHRFKLVKMYEKQGMAPEKARKKVLDEEVIHDFKIEFQELGFPRDQAQKQAERRLWLIENLEQQGMSAEEASQKVADIEADLKKSLGIVPEKKSGCYDGVVTKHSTEEARWQQAEEAVKRYVQIGCDQLKLSPEKRRTQLTEALQCLGHYRKEKVAPEEAKRRLFTDDLPFTVDINLLTGGGSKDSPVVSNLMSASLPKDFPAKATTVHSDDNRDTASDKSQPESAILGRIMHFLGKLDSQHAPSIMDTDESALVAQSSEGKHDGMAAKPEEKSNKSEELTDEDRERLLAEYDKKSRLEIQTLLAEMLRQQVPHEEAKQKLEVLYAVHAGVREQLYPSKNKTKPDKLTGKSRNQAHDSPHGEEASSKHSASTSKSRVRRDVSHSPTATKKKDRTRNSERFSPHEVYSVSDISDSPSLKDKERSRSPTTRKLSRSRSPHRKRTSLSPLPHRTRRSYTRSPRAARRSSHSSSPRRSHRKLLSPSRHSSRKRHSVSPVSESEDLLTSLSAGPEIQKKSGSGANPDDNWKSSVEMFLKQTAKKTSKRSPSSHSSYSGSGKGWRRFRRSRSTSFSRSRSRSRGIDRLNRSRVRRVARRSRSLSSISGESGVENPRARVRRASRRSDSRSLKGSQHSLSRGAASDRRNRSISSRSRDRSRSPSFHSRNSSRRARRRLRSNSRERSRGHTNCSRRSSSSRERIRSVRRRSDLSPVSGAGSPRSRDGSRSSYSKRSSRAKRPRQSLRQRDSLSPDPQRLSPDSDDFRVKSPLRSLHRNPLSRPCERSPDSLDRLSSSTLSSSSSCFSEEEHRITEPLRHRPSPPRGPPTPFRGPVPNVRGPFPGPW